MPGPQSPSVPIYFQTQSAAPPEPTSSSLPPDSRPCESDTSTPNPGTDGSGPSPPKVRLRLELRDLRHASTKTFLDNTNATEDVATLSDTVVKLLYHPRTRQDIAATPSSTSSASRPHPYKPHVPDTRSVTLILREMDGVAYTTGLDLDDSHKEIHFALSYIQHVAGSKDSAKIRKEILGVICHELVHCWQYNGQGTAPGGLIEGIADWVRLRAGFVPPHWKREAGKDTKWDAGYQITGYFLDWIENKCGEGSVRRINESLRREKYEDAKFWQGLFGSSVDELWSSYKRSLESQDL